jgi:hypothetical protein
VNALGDFQTPPELAARVLAAVRAHGGEPARILEPTCGSGAFLAAAATAFPQAEIIGIEYQRDRYGAALDAVCDRHRRVSVRYANAYELDFARLAWRTDGPLLVVGNPPWVTAAALGRSTGEVVQPPRTNPRRLRGLAARTGAANFDVAEFLLLKLVRELLVLPDLPYQEASFGRAPESRREPSSAANGEPPRFAMLVKESVARNVLTQVQVDGLGITAAEIVRIDARHWFGVAVDACCLFLTPAARRGDSVAAAAIRTDFFSVPQSWWSPTVTPARAAGAPGAFGKPAIVFRQGVKHDAADVFELRRAGKAWRNGYGEAVAIEAEFIYPLLKAGALHAGHSPGATALIVPQQRLGASTADLAVRAPRLWRYLNEHAPRIAARKSSIYRNAPRFALFGIGPYSFAPWKVAVAGFYAQPRFRVVGPHDGRPVVFGDTSYFAPFEGEADARAFAAVCNSAAAAALIAQTVVPGKRPITKALLDGIDWPAHPATSNVHPQRLASLEHEALAT